MELINITEQNFIKVRREYNQVSDDFKRLYDHLHNRLTAKQFFKVCDITKHSLKYNDTLQAMKRVTKNQGLLADIERAELLLKDMIEVGARFRTLKNLWLMSA